MTASIYSTLMGQTQFAHSGDMKALEKRLNQQFATLFAAHPAIAGGLELLRLTVSSHDGTVDTPVATQLKINRMLKLLSQYTGVQTDPVQLDTRNPSAAGFTSVASELVNSTLQKISNASDPAAPGGYARELAGRFPWMAFGQPIAQMSYWAGVGVNILDHWSPQVSGLSGYSPWVPSSFSGAHAAAAAAWDSAAIAQGFKIARYPFTAERAAADLAYPMRNSVAAWTVQDEPELIGFDLGLQLPILDAADPTYRMVRSMNNTGTQLVYQGSAVFPYFVTFSPYPSVQMGFDWYPVQQTVAGKCLFTGYNSDARLYTATVNSAGLASARVPQWVVGGVTTANPSAGRPYTVVIATAGGAEDYQPELRVPTPTQVRFFIGDAILNGAEGISFFPQKFEMVNSVRTFMSHNGTPSDVTAALTTLIANWKALETAFSVNLLVSPATNRKWPAVYRFCPDTAPSGQQTAAESGLAFVAPPSTDYLPGPFQGSKRVTSAGNVYFVQNMMDEAKSLTDSVWGFFQVPFAARETLVFFENDKANPVWSDMRGVL